MYIIKNALRCIGRSKGRNILIGVIVLVIAVSSCIGLSIRQAADDAKEKTMDSMTITATISFDRQAMMSEIGKGTENSDSSEPPSFDRSQFSAMMGESSSLSLEEYLTYAQADSVKDFYYTMTAFLSSVPVTNALLENQIESEESESQRVEKNFGRSSMEIPDNMGGNMSSGMGEISRGGMSDMGNNPFKNILDSNTRTEYISEINSAMNFTVVLQMLGIAVLLTLISSAVSTLFVMRYEPLKILANRD